MNKTSDFNTFSIRVRYAETDQMGVVYHGNYAQYLEYARVEWLRKLGVSYKSMEEKGIILPVVYLQTKFIKPATYDEVLKVQLKLKQRPGVKIEFDYQIYNEKEELLVIANTVLAFVNQKTRKPMMCPNYILNLLA